MNRIVKCKKRLLVFLIVLVSNMCYLSGGAITVQAADTVTIDGITYELDTWMQEATAIGYTEEMAAEVTIPATISVDETSYSVKTIGEKAFHNCATLTSVVLSEGVENIEMSAFEWCTGLKSLSLPESLSSIDRFVFRYCKSLVSVEIPAGLERISGSAFAFCESMESVTISEGVMEIGDYAFSYCDVLNNVVLPSTVKSLGNYVFSGSESLTSITIPDGVTTIGDSAFYACTALTSVDMPDSVTTIKTNAFYSCSNLTNVVIPDSVTSIDSNAFSGCKNMSSVYYPEALGDSLTNTGLESIGTRVSYTENEDGTVTLTIVAIPEGAEELVLPENICGKEITAVEGLEGSDITISCSVHRLAESYDEIAHWTANICELCKETVSGEIEKIKHDYGDGDDACECGYIPFEITSQPIGLTLYYGYMPVNKMSVTVKTTLGGEAISYQWYENEKLISGANASDYVIPVGKNAGNYTYSCYVSCGGYAIMSDVATVTINVCEHAWNGGEITKQATPLEAGIKTYTCTICSVTKNEDVPALGAHAKGSCHKDDKNQATYKITKAGLKGGTVEYVKPVYKKKSTVSIPATVKIDGIAYKVTSIAKNAFKGNRSIKKLTIGKNVAKIGKQAFNGCKNLKNITIRTTKLTAKKVGAKAFKGIKSNATIKVPKKKLKAYKSMLLKKGVSKKAKIRKI